MAEERLKKTILVLVEGANTDVALIKHLFRVYELDFDYNIVSYNTNIYVLYNDMFRDGDPDSMDIIQVLKTREKDSAKRELLDAQYTDILLVFDLDPHDGGFSGEKIRSMLCYFSESSDMGKLYINYPMVESFYHMKSIPDTGYYQYVATMHELSSRKYKERVNQENRDRCYSKFAINRKECNAIIGQNMSKVKYLTGEDIFDNEHGINTLTRVSILEKQLSLIDNERVVSVLCTCIFFIPEYNPDLIKDNS